MGLNMYKGLLAGLEDRLERMERPPVITLTTDFGLHDGYVAAMKGVIHALLPDATVVDISHQVAPQQIQEGAFILYRAYRYFPASAIHVAVVDPGVGTSRRPIVLTTRHGTFVGPDNGIFTYVLRAELGHRADPDLSGRRPAWVGGMWSVAPNWEGDDDTLPDDSHPEDAPRAFNLTNSYYWLSNVSHTFHGRDVFAPVAAHLASGAPVARMGESISLASLVKLPTAAPALMRSGRGTMVMGQILYIDHFGNIITNLPERLLDPLLQEAGSSPVTVDVGDYRINGLSTSYEAVSEGQAVALIGSENLLEVAVRNASAAHRMKVRIGDPVRISVKREA